MFGLSVYLLLIDDDKDKRKFECIYNTYKFGCTLSARIY